MNVARWLVALAVSLQPACGGAGSAVEAPRAEAELPPTDRDPPPWVPEPSDEPHTGRAVGVVTSGGLEQARAVTLRVVEALRDADRQALEEHLADPIGRIRPRLLSPRIARAQIIAQVTAPRHQQYAVGTDTPLEELIDADQIEVVPLAQHEQAAELPEGFLPTDLLVTVPIREPGRRFLGIVLQWLGEGRLVIRPGADPRVVAL